MLNLKQNKIITLLNLCIRYLDVGVIIILFLHIVTFSLYFDKNERLSLYFIIILRM